jgi:phage gp46-like protein
MPDIRFLQQADFPGYAVQLDWLLTPLHLLDDGDALQSAVIVAFGTDALAGKTDILPGLDDDDRAGWWGDLDAEEIWNGWPVGSLFWLLRRTKITGPLSSEGSTVARASAYGRKCVRPLIDQQIASRIDVSAERTDVNRIDVEVTIYRGPLPAVALRFQQLWEV